MTTKRAPMLLRTAAAGPGKVTSCDDPVPSKNAPFLSKLCQPLGGRGGPSVLQICLQHMSLRPKHRQKGMSYPILDLTLCYTSNSSDFQIMCMCHGQVSSCKYPRLKEVDDVLGGAAAWENVDTTDGELIYTSRTKTGVPLIITCCHSNTVLWYL